MFFGSLPVKEHEDDSKQRKIIEWTRRSGTLAAANMDFKVLYFFDMVIEVLS